MTPIGVQRCDAGLLAEKRWGERYGPAASADLRGREGRGRDVGDTPRLAALLRSGTTIPSDLPGLPWNII
jgi:hypothetical protein